MPNGGRLRERCHPRWSRLSVGFGRGIGNTGFIMFAKNLQVHTSHEGCALPLSTPAAFTAIAKGLAGHPEALLAFGLGAIATTLVWLGVNQWLACGFPTIIWFGYLSNRLLADSQKRELAEMDVRKLELGRGKPLIGKRQKRGSTGKTT